MKPSNRLKLFTFSFSLLTLFSCSNNENNYDAMGVFEATEVVVSAKAQGEIISLDLNEGDEVKADSTLGFIDATKLNLQQQSLQDNRDAQTARILNLQEQTGSIQQQISNLQQEHERFSGLLAKGAATQKQVDDLANQIKVLKAQLAATQSQLRAANESIQHQADASNQQMKIVGSQMDDAIVKSPINGTILKKYAERLSVVYDLAIKHPGDKKYHSVSVKSELLIPVSQNVRKRTVERGAFD